MVSAAMRVWPGQPYPPGATWTGLGLNFAIFSSQATHVDLYRTLAVFTIDSHGRYRRASNHAGISDDAARRVVP